MRDTPTVCRPALISVVVCGLLLAVGLLRLVSYWPESALGSWLRGSPLSWAAYDPDRAWNVQFFKIIATPTVVAGMYFIFRLLNRGHRVRVPGYEFDDSRQIDFRSPWVRLILTTVVSLHWIPIEYAKFQSENFYPYSALENARLNVVVLLASQALAFWGMRFLSFDPLRMRADADAP